MAKTTESDKATKTVKRDILARDVPESLYATIVDLHSKALIAGERKSLGAILIELAEKGASKKI